MSICKMHLRLLVAAPSLVLLAALAALPAFAQQPASRPGGWVVLRAQDFDAHTTVPPRPAVDKAAEKTAQFLVTYNGFTPAAQNAFQRAVDIWSTLVTSSVPIRVQANWTPLDEGVLGAAGARTFWRDFGGAPQANTWYSEALADALAGGDLGEGEFDIFAQFNSNFDWYLGTDGNPANGQFDLVTVVLHELGHGLGFSGSMRVEAGTGSWGVETGFPFVYDRFTQDLTGNGLINQAIYANVSTPLAGALQNGNVFFAGPMATTANGGSRPRLYAPAAWVPGTSYSHLDEASYPTGTLNSLMTPFLAAAEAVHDPGPVTLCLFEDTGWTTTESCAATTGPCVADDTTLCIDDQPGDARFRVRLHFDTALGGGVSGDARATSLASLGIPKGGILSFTDATNPEVLVKVLNGCSITNHYWVFFAATTTVGFTLTVDDTVGGQTQTYTNPDQTAATTITDTEAFATCP